MTTLATTPPVNVQTGEPVLACESHIGDGLRALDALRPWVDRVKGRRSWRSPCEWCHAPAEWAIGDSWPEVERFERELVGGALRISERYGRPRAR